MASRKYAMPLRIEQRQSRWLGSTPPLCEVKYGMFAYLSGPLTDHDYSDVGNQIKLRIGHSMPEITDPIMARFVEGCHTEPRLGRVAISNCYSKPFEGHYYGDNYISFYPHNDAYEAWDEVGQTARNLLTELFLTKFPDYTAIAFYERQPPQDWGTPLQ